MDKLIDRYNQEVAIMDAIVQGITHSGTDTTDEQKIGLAFQWDQYKIVADEMKTKITKAE